MGATYDVLCRQAVELTSISNFEQLLDTCRDAHNSGVISGVQYCDLRFIINLAREFWTDPDQS